MTRNGPTTMGDSLMRCHASGEFSDLTLVCEGHEFKVHKVLICSQIEAIHAACTGNFQEAQTGVYEFEDESYIIVSKMVSFLYTQTYDDSQGPEGDDNAMPKFSDLQLHARVFAFADRYHIPRLMSFSVEKYQARLDFLRTQPNSWRKNELPPDTPRRLASLRSEISPSTIEFLESVPDVFNLTPAAVINLRYIYLTFAHDNFPYYSTIKSFREPYENMLLEAPQFAKGLLDLFFVNTLDRERDSEFLNIPNYDKDRNRI
ncbi:hypothetical protein N7528_001011 [Penicillium herquei]|nr:hypothetical protein N7528_001011 [Penicillium herquei]